MQSHFSFFLKQFVLNLVPFYLRIGERPALSEKNYNFGSGLSYLTQIGPEIRRKRKRGVAKDLQRQTLSAVLTASRLASAAKQMSESEGHTDTDSGAECK